MLGHYGHIVDCRGSKLFVRAAKLHAGAITWLEWRECFPSDHLRSPPCFSYLLIRVPACVHKQNGKPKVCRVSLNAFKRSTDATHGMRAYRLKFCLT